LLDQERRDSRPRIRAYSGMAGTLLLLAVGLLVGLFTNIAAIALAGAGHGWCSPISVSWIALIMGPLAGVAWRLRSPLFALALLAVMAAADCILVMETFKEGTYYFLKSWQSMPEAVVTWAGMWLYGQVLIAAALIAGYASSQRPPWQTQPH
jgi:hypothetical protein